MLILPQQCVTTNASSISHPNIPHMIAVSPIASEHTFLVLNGGLYEAVYKPKTSTQT